MSITIAINKAKKKLINQVKIKGLYENFGQKEVRNIEDTFIDFSDYSPEMNKKRKELNEFNEWCMTYEVKELK